MHGIYISLQRSDTVNICLTDDTPATDETLLLTKQNSRITGYMRRKNDIEHWKCGKYFSWDIRRLAKFLDRRLAKTVRRLKTQLILCCSKTTGRGCRNQTIIRHRRIFKTSWAALPRREGSRSSKAARTTKTLAEIRFKINVSWHWTLWRRHSITNLSSMSRVVTLQVESNRLSFFSRRSYINTLSTSTVTCTAWRSASTWK